ncbi:MAG: hypothetical protein GX811_10070, partial [Lentisphaerae bacterium]|nr:hypothetical protein [Lentisphaerota bacterium]
MRKTKLFSSDKLFCRTLILICCLLLIPVISSKAAVRTWIGGSGDGSASIAANWGENDVPGPGDSIYLDANSHEPMIWDLNVPVASWTQDGYQGTVTIKTVYPDKGSFTSLVIEGDCLINSGIWTHMINGSSEVYRMKVVVDGSFTLGIGAELNVESKGYEPQTGPGCPVVGTGGSSSHGGMG